MRYFVQVIISVTKLFYTDSEGVIVGVVTIAITIVTVGILIVANVAILYIVLCNKNPSSNLVYPNSCFTAEQIAKQRNISAVVT